jgi:hypothetical protein
MRFGAFLRLDDRLLNFRYFRLSHWFLVLIHLGNAGTTIQKQDETR